MKKSIGQSGFSLVELMVSLSVLSLAVWGLTNVVTLNAKSQRNATTELEITALFERVQQIAGAEWSCTASLGGSIYTGAVVIKDPVDNTAVIGNETDVQSEYWNINEIRMQNVQEVPGQAGVLRGSLYVLVSKNMNLNIGAPLLSRTISDIYFEVNPDQSIARCYTTSETIAAAQSACQLIGGTWNPAAGEGPKCVI